MKELYYNPVLKEICSNANLADVKKSLIEPVESIVNKIYTSLFPIKKLDGVVIITIDPVKKQSIYFL
jgi:hypothetical protein